jgi:DNA recombination protein RmuC
MEISIIIALLVVLILINIFVLLRKKEKINFDEVLKNNDRIEQSVKFEISGNREELSRNLSLTKNEINTVLKNFGDSQRSSVSEISNLQKNYLESFTAQLNKLSDSSVDELKQMRQMIESKLITIQENNQEQLDKMRETVDEKLHNTLERRLSESFKLVSERLELVQSGLGEMKTLATGVIRLEKVLSNVKTKGVLGEYQLHNILEQILTPEQYSMNVKTKEGSGNMVEFAVKLPGSGKTKDSIWLPIDSKFPTEDYENLLTAYDNSDSDTVELRRKQLITKINSFAKDISEKYIDPPNTTDFAIMFLPFEGLYAEVLRNAGLFEDIMKNYKVTIAGPTTISAFLNSLQMGFRTLAIEKRSSEVWEILKIVKKEFGKFGDVLEKTKSKLRQASDEIDKAGVRTRAIERKLKDVEDDKPDEKKILAAGETDSDTTEVSASEDD